MTAYNDIIDYLNVQLPTGTGNLSIDENKIADFVPLTSAIPKQVLLITDAAIISSDDSTTLVRGKISILSQAGLPAVLTIKNGPLVEVTLTAELKDGWTWEDTFVNLPGTYRPMAKGGLFVMGKTLLVDFEYRHPRWILTNTEDIEKGIRPGLNFAATALLNDFKSVISEFFHWTEMIELSGSVRVFPQTELHPVIHLKMGSSVRDLQIPPVVIRDLEVSIGTTDPQKSLLTHETFLEITGEAVLDESTTPVTVQKVTTVFAPGRHVYRIHGEAADESLSLGNGLDKLAELLAGESSEFTLLESLSFIGGIHFQSLDVSINFSAMTLEYLGVRIGSSKSWTVIPKVIQIESLVLDCLIDWPLKSELRALSMLLYGRLSLGSENPVMLDVYARMDEGYALFGNLPKGETIDLQTLLSEYVSDSADIPNLDIYFLDFYAEPGTGTYSFATGIKSDWTIDIRGNKHLVFRNTTFQLARSLSAERKTETQAQLEVQLEIAGVWVTLIANNPAGDSGWTFKGNAKTNAGLLVADMLGALTDLFGFDDTAVPLPESLRQLSFRNPAIVFNTKTKHFTLGCELLIPINDKNAYPGGDVNILLRFAYDFKNKTFFLGWSVASIDLANLPMIRDKLPATGKLAIHHLQMNYASGAFTPQAMSLLNELNAFYFATPAVSSLTKGLKLDAEIVIDTVQQRLSFPVDPDGNSVEPPVVAGGQTMKLVAAAGVIWFPVGKKIGPATFERIGVSYKNKAIALYLDAALQSGPLNISMLGLTVSVPLNTFEPKFNIQGLGLLYDNPNAQIGGSFLKGTLDYEGKTYKAFSGGALLKLAPSKQGSAGKHQGGFTLSAMGSYIMLDDPSLLVYAVLDKAIGGPSFFFVTGLAAGFGYNRHLNIPPLYRLPEFPLISAVLNPTTGASDIANEMRKLAPYIPPARGEYFFALGVKATSFGLMESFALFTLSLTDNIRFDIIGSSRVRLPPPSASKTTVPEVVNLELAFKASFDPDKGSLSVQAQLTPNSFLFSRNCRISGGFAFFVWMAGDYAGDFVQTLGGYHPAFKRPEHYPLVPRAAFNWQLDSKTYIKGALYYALIPSAIMAGGHLEAVYQSGDFKAWYRQSIDFLISWKPFFYQAQSRVNIGASYQFTVLGIRSSVTLDVGADVQIWGPPFGGRAKVNISVFSFEVKFGAANLPVPEPISWNEFKASFLPAAHEICTVSVMDGLVARADDAIVTDLGTLNPKSFALNVNSVIPAKMGNANEEFGIAPMGKSRKQIKSAKLDIVITWNGEEYDGYAFTPVKKNMPAGLWGQFLQASEPIEDSLIKNVLVGYEVRPAVMPSADASKPIAVKDLLVEMNDDTKLTSWHWETQSPREDLDLEEANRETRINDSILTQATASNRLGILESLGITEPELTLNKNIGGTFVFAPRIEKVAESG